MTRNWLSIVAAMPMFVGFGCARVPTTQTQLRFELSAQSGIFAQSSDDPSQQMPALFTVSRSDGSQPQHFELLPGQARVLDLPRGAVVIQALMFTPMTYPGLLPDSDNRGGMQPYFALQSVTLDQPEQTVVLSLQAPRQFLTGEVAGRYLSTTNGGPTGDIEYNIKIKSHLPPIKLGKKMDNSYIVNGWFQLFSLRSEDVLGIEYLLPDGTNIFGPGAIKNIDNLIEVSAPNTQPTAQVQLSVPWSAKIRSSGYVSGSPTYQFDGFREPEVYTLGFWGPARATTQGAQFYYPGTNFLDVLIPKTYRYQSDLRVQTSSELESYQGNTTNAIKINSTLSSLSDLYFLLTGTTQLTAGSPTQQGGGGGFLRGSHLTSTDTLNIESTLVLDPTTLSQSGKDGFGAFRGFLRAVNFPSTASYPNPFNGWTTYRQPSDKLLQVLPGIKIDSLAVYQNLTANEFDDRELNCLDPSNPNLTLFTGQVELIGNDQQTTSISLDPFPSQAKNLILCPTFKAGYRPTRPTVLYQHQYRGLCDQPSVTSGTLCDDGSYYLGTLNVTGSIYKYFSAPASDVEYQWGPSDQNSTLTSDEGANNTQNADANYPAANFCKNTSFLVYTDWFLPSPQEFVAFHSALNGLPDPYTLTAGDYWTSKQEDNWDAFIYRTTAVSTNLSSTKTNSHKIRCMRRVPIN